MRRPLALISSVVLCAPLALPRGAWANSEASISASAAEPGPNPEEARLKEASQRFQKGLTFYDQGEAKLALVEFEKAYELVPDYRVLYNLGLVAIQLGEFARARVALESYLRQGGESVDAGRKAEIERDLEMLRARTAVLRVETKEPEVLVLVDDVPVGETPSVEPLVLDVGPHRVSFRRDGYEATTERVTLAGGEEKTVAVQLRPVKPQLVTVRERPLPPPVMQPSGPPVGAWVGWGVTAALATGAIATGVYGIGQASSLNALKQTPDPSPSQMDQLSSSASTALLATDALIVGTGVALAVSTYLTFFAPRDRDKAAQARSLGVALSPTLIQAYGAF